MSVIIADVPLHLADDLLTIPGVQSVERLETPTPISATTAALVVGGALLAMLALGGRKR
jgi:hypothetical protein